MASCRSAEAVEGTRRSVTGGSLCPAPLLGSAPGRGGVGRRHAPSRATAAPPEATPAPIVRPTLPLDDAVILADSAPATGPFAIVEDGRVTTWCTGADERFAWRWFEQLAAQGVRAVLARLDGCLAVFRTPLPLDPEDVVGPGKRRRPCLRCGRPFVSAGPGNRICRFCVIRNAGVMPGFGRPEDG
jgi:hypothetical protein